MLWQLGCEHGDPSLANLMADGHFGVINDWDLSHKTGENHVGGERTGTLPFMALDLLEDGALAGKTTRLYRHDLEGLIWILPWVFLQFEDGRLVNVQLTEWCTGNHVDCRAHKTDLLDRMSDAEPTASWSEEWDVAYTALQWVEKLRDERRSKARENKANRTNEPFQEPPAEDMYPSFLRQLWGSRQLYPTLEELMRELEMVPS